MKNLLFVSFSFISSYKPFRWIGNISSIYFHQLAKSAIHRYFWFKALPAAIYFRRSVFFKLANPGRNCNFGCHYRSFKDQKSHNYNALYYALRLIVRYRLVIGVIGYGMIKFFPLQSPYPSISKNCLMLQPTLNFKLNKPVKLHLSNGGGAPMRDINRTFEITGTAGGRRAFYYDADTTQHLLFLQDKNVAGSRKPHEMQM